MSGDQTALRGRFFRSGPIGLLAALAAVAAPALLTQPSLPWSNFQANAAALMGWGLWLAWLAWLARGAAIAPRPTGLHRIGLYAVFAIVAVLAFAACASWLWFGWPGRILLRHLVVLAAVALALYAGARLTRSTAGTANDPVVLFLWALVVTGAANALIAWAQYLGLTDWLPGVAPMSRDGRPGGQLRQPNLLGTQLIWALAALVPLQAMQRCTPRRFLALVALLVSGLALCGSRTAVLSSLVLAAWGAMDRQIDRRVRITLVALPFVLALGWLALWWAAQHGGQGFGGAQTLQKADLTSSRGRLWLQTLRLIQNDPWTGVGYGQFNFAWTLTPMEGLPRVARYTFTHAHNLFLHWAAELGLPLAVTLLLLLGTAAWAAIRGNWGATAPGSQTRRAAAVMVLVMLLHSQLELPLWQLNFLLPTAFLWGLAFAVPPTEPPAASAVPSRLRRHGAVWCGFALCLAGGVAVQQYRAIADVYMPSEGSPADDVRFARAQQSWLFGHLGDRFAGTLAPAGQRTLTPFREVPFELIDLNLLTSWAAAYKEAGDGVRADYLRARLAEFTPQSAAQAPAARAADGDASGDDRLSYRDFR